MEGRYRGAETTVASVSPAAVHTVGSLEEVLSFIQRKLINFLFIEPHDRIKISTPLLSKSYSGGNVELLKFASRQPNIYIF